MAKKKSGLGGVDVLGKKEKREHPAKSFISTSKVTEDDDALKNKGTHMRPSVIKQLKLKCVELEMREYEIIEAALLEYFAKN